MEASFIHNSLYRLQSLARIPQTASNVLPTFPSIFTIAQGLIIRANTFETEVIVLVNIKYKIKYKLN